MPHGRSGSLLVHTLFDGHPEVVSFPSFHMKYDYFTLPDDPMASAQALVKAHPELFDTSKSYFGNVGYATSALLGDAGDRNAAVNAQDFLGYFEELSSQTSRMSRRDFFCAIHVALAKAIGQDPRTVRYILFHLHDYVEGAVDALLADFPRAHFMATIRDPREAVFSTLQVVKQRKKSDASDRDLLEAIYFDMKAYFNLAHRADAFLPDRIRFVDMNVLHRVQESGMRRLASWLGIAFSPILCRTTVLGLTWWGNAADRRRISGFDQTKSTLKFRQHLSPEQIRTIESLFSSVIHAFGYSAPMHRATSMASLFRLARQVGPLAGLRSSIGQAREQAMKRSSFNNPLLRRIPLAASRIVFFVYLVVRQPPRVAPTESMRMLLRCRHFARAIKLKIPREALLQ